MSSPIVQAIRQVCEEKGLTYESVMVTIEAAMAAAFRKDFGEKNQNVKVEFDPESGSMRVFDVKTVVEDISPEELEKLWEEPAQNFSTKNIIVEKIKDQKNLGGLENTARLDLPVTDGNLGGEPEKPRFNPKTMLMISEARKTNPEAALGEELHFELEVPHAFGRMAAQTAKQVITQKLREAERQIIFDEFKGREGEVLTGTIGRREGPLVLIDLGRATAIMPPGEQVDNEIYKPGARLKIYLIAVNLTTKGPELVVSRRHPEMVKKIFSLEIPEIQNGTVEIKNVAREAGSRTKIAVFSSVANIDPIGACIGQRGSRIQTIIGELGGEKIDVIKWEEDQGRFISNALSPAKVLSIDLNESEKTANVKVDPTQLSLAIGRGGQNVRLASALTGWRIRIEGAEIAPVESASVEAEKKEETAVMVVEESAVAEAKEVKAPASLDASQGGEETDKPKKTTKKKSKREAVKEEVVVEEKKD